MQQSSEKGSARALGAGSKACPAGKPDARQGGPALGSCCAVVGNSVGSCCSSWGQSLSVGPGDFTVTSPIPTETGDAEPGFWLFPLLSSWRLWCHHPQR